MTADSNVRDMQLALSLDGERRKFRVYYRNVARALDDEDWPDAKAWNEKLTDELRRTFLSEIDEWAANCRRLSVDDVGDPRVSVHSTVVSDQMRPFLARLFGAYNAFLKSRHHTPVLQPPAYRVGRRLTARRLLRGDGRGDFERLPENVIRSIRQRIV